MSVCRVRVLRALVNRAVGVIRPYSNTANNGDLQETAQQTPDDTEEDLIEQKRNKSSLRWYHYRQHHGQVTRLSESEEILAPLWKHRKMYARYGASSGIDVGKLWPSIEELELEKEYEKVARPHSVHEMIRMAKQAKDEEERATKQRQEDLKKKVLLLESWKREVKQRVEQREREAQIAKEKKDKLIEEVREILGFQIDPRDEKFKEALLQKEQAEKKAKKAAKKLAAQERMIERMRREADIPSTESSTNKKKTDGEGSNISPGAPIV